MTRIHSVLLVTLAVFTLSLSLHAHTEVVSPNGGESLTPGEMVEIRWIEIAVHNTIGYHLAYSVNGSSGPWLSIAQNLDPNVTDQGSYHSFLWQVPTLNADSVRIRVQQDNVNTDYMDISDDDLGIGNTLSADVFEISIASGGMQTLQVRAGTDQGFLLYTAAGSISGSSPGFDYQGIHVPLNFDFYTDATRLGLAPSPLQNHIGALDAAGEVVVTVAISAGAVPASLSGLVIHHAVAAFDFSGDLQFVTNAAPLTLIP